MAAFPTVRLCANATFALLRERIPSIGSRVDLIVIRIFEQTWKKRIILMGVPTMSDADTFETVLLERADGVATVTLNRPDKLNSFTAQMHAEVRSALQTIEGDERIRALVLTGAGRGFCAGQDLGDRDVSDGAAPPDLGETLDTLYNPLVKKLRSLEMPVIAAVNGVAAGAGCNIALACDLVFAAQSAKFIQAFCKIGLVPDSGGTWTLPRLVGRQRAFGMALLGEPVTAPMAEDWGLIWKCVPDEELMPSVAKLAKHLATQPTKGLAYIKQALNQSSMHSLEQQLDLERDRRPSPQSQN